MNLSTLLTTVDVLSISSAADPDITHISRDSREISLGGLFVAVVGVTVDGHRFVSGLSEAAVVVVSRVIDAPEGVVVVTVVDTKLVLAQMSAAFYGHPSQQMRVVGVTGTNGKTTVTTLVDKALRYLGLGSGRIGTTGSYANGKLLPTKLTTPEAPELQRTLHRMSELDVDVVSMEVSSIGLDQRRVDGTKFVLGVFTNLSRDHLDYHHTMEDYAAAKGRMFSELLLPGRQPNALVCADDDAIDDLPLPKNFWTYGEREGADLQIIRYQCGPNGSVLTVQTPFGAAEIESPMIGRYNALNLTAGLGIGLLLGVDVSKMAEALGSVDLVDGRLERVANSAGLLVVIDYAHSPDALEAVLRELRPITEGRLWAVFGCGGDRDLGKRPLMGAVASNLADRVVVTSDNPRSEAPSLIIDQIMAGVSGYSTCSIEDRVKAITFAIGEARAGDTVLIAGKGHERTQEVNGEMIEMDDRETAVAALGAK